MKRTLFLICILLTGLFSTGCFLVSLIQEAPVEEPLISVTDTSEPISPPIATETPRPTDIPLATYTPTSEPIPEPTFTPTQEPIENLSGPFSITNIDRIQTTSLQNQESIRYISWFTAPADAVGFFSEHTLTIIEEANAGLMTTVDVPEEYYVFSISPSGNLIACTDDYERILLLEATNLEQRAVVNPETFVANVHFNLDGTKILITSMDEMVAIEADTLTGEILKTHTGFSTAAPVYDAVFSRYTGDIVWYARGRMQLQNPINEMLSSDFAHEDWINDFAISPDGEHLAVATAKSYEGDYSAGIQLWHIATGQALDFIPTDNMPVALFYTPDGSLLIGTDGVFLKFWNATTGELVQQVAGHIDSIYKASLSPAGDALLTASYDGQIVLWALP